jgi:hypothetical protein
MESAIVQVRGNARLDQIIHAVHFLLVRNQMFDCSYDTSALDAFDGKSSTERL